MRRTQGLFLVSGLLYLALSVTASHAQSVAASSVPAPDSVASAPDSATPDSATDEGKKKGGLFGKAKKFVGDKTVQQVAKTVACNMVPGGQVVAGAIDAASSKDVGDAAADAAGAATGQTCMPGGLGGAVGGTMGAAAGVPGPGGVGGGMPGALGAAGLAGSMMGTPGEDAAGEMPEGAMGYGAMPGMPAPEQIATCLGMTVEEYRDFTDPTRGQARPLTKEEMKRQSQASKKIDMHRYQACMMEHYTGGMAR
jgi:hypothetical protein